MYQNDSERFREKLFKADTQLNMVNQKIIFEQICPICYCFPMQCMHVFRGLLHVFMTHLFLVSSVSVIVTLIVT